METAVVGDTVRPLNLCPDDTVWCAEYRNTFGEMVKCVVAISVDYSLGYVIIMDFPMLSLVPRSD